MDDKDFVTADWQRALSVVIPAYNEEEGIGIVLGELCRRLPAAEIIVVDDRSADHTFHVASTFPGVRVLRHSTNRGYGAAVKTGMLAATRANVAWIDADGEYAVDDLIDIARRIEAEGLGAIITQRRQASPSLVRLVGKWVIRMLAQSLEFKGGHDLNSGLRIFRRDIIVKYLGVLPNGFSASMTSTMTMIERGYDVAFHPIDSHERVGTSKVRLNDGFTALVLVLRTIMLFAPLRIFLRAGMALMAVGLVYGVWHAAADGVGVGDGIPTSAVLATLTGLLLCMLGLIADQISQIRLGLFETIDRLAPQPVEIGARATPPARIPATTDAG